MMRTTLVALILSLTSCSTFGVDRSKFRTCEQTSFCRRHRNDHSARLYRYRVEKDSVQFHLPSEDSDEVQKEAAGAAASASGASTHGGGLWTSLSKRLLGDGSGAEGEGKLDPYVKGPPPTLTAVLSNTATETSTGKKEELQFSLHALEDGMVRMRITEIYGAEGTAHEKARVTYDHLVLEHDQIVPAPHALYVQPGDERLLSYGVVVVGGDSSADNFFGLQYGDKRGEHSMMLLVRIDSFALFLYREGENTPIVVLGSENRMHFEVRRFKDEEGAAAAAAAGDQVPKKDEDDMSPPKNDPPKKGEKEIVGYWEDGLAIYADGTREEKKDEEEEVDNEESGHRKLAESELDQRGMWEENFHGHKDSKPHGPMSVGMDVSFPKSQHVFGLPEHASSTALRATRGDGAHYREPYRLYNLDVFEYELDETMALYGGVPLVVSHSKDTGTAGLFWFNPTETFVDVDIEPDVSNHFISESGVIDLFMIPGPTPQDLYRQYAKTTGKVPLPPMFSLGYHQCRWNYKDEKDVYMVHETFEDLDYPYDVLWLDIEHTDGKRYFTWDDNLFPHPKEMQEKLWSQGRRMVTIIDPHIKRDGNYHVHKEATAKGLYIKDSDGKKDFDGWCWPGSSSYLDFTQEKVRNWWAEQFSYNKYQGSTPSLFTWNDMNEPSVFNGPEVSMSKDLLNLNGEEHREWHNLYGMLFHRATGEGQIKRNDDKDVRPFVLSRAFFAGSQKYGAIWTGDNEARWSHLAIASPMLLSLNVAALSFVGADVGGFFGNPDAELMTRWMQAGAYQPFFRGHAHHDAKRREPWMFGDETMKRLRKAAMARYALLPYWYSTFQEAAVTGMPVMRTMWMQYPRVEQLFGTDDQFLIGADLLVKPVTEAGITETAVAFPTKDVWYDVDTMQPVGGGGAMDAADEGVVEVTVSSDIDKIPVYQRGGSVIPRKLRLRRSALLMKTDPYTLYVALDRGKKAGGRLYMDDEETFGHEERGEFAEASFEADFGKPRGFLRCKVSAGNGWSSQLSNLRPHRMIERVIVMGVDEAPQSVTLNGDPGSAIIFDYVAPAKLLVFRKPGVSALEDWEIVLE